MSTKGFWICAIVFLVSRSAMAKEICTPPSEKTLHTLGPTESLDGFKFSAPKGFVLAIDRDSFHHETNCKWSPPNATMPLLELQHRDAAAAMLDLNAGIEELSGVKRVMLNLPIWHMSPLQDCTIGDDVYRCITWEGKTSKGKKFFGFIYITVTKANKAVSIWGTAQNEAQLEQLSAAAKSYR